MSSESEGTAPQHRQTHPHVQEIRRATYPAKLERDTHELKAKLEAEETEDV
ncbi:MAG TPA: hypothetical protein VKX49_01815 [Bryobacteraceae bacterium]|nr:hypothetical protein [Bryobacteraceae bacterium]